MRGRELLIVYICMEIFFNQTRRRAAYHYIKKKKWEEPSQTHTNTTKTMLQSDSPMTKDETTQPKQTHYTTTKARR
jgi:hypothetical protein